AGGSAGRGARDGRRSRASAGRARKGPRAADQILRDSRLGATPRPAARRAHARSPRGDRLLPGGNRSARRCGSGGLRRLTLSFDPVLHRCPRGLMPMARSRESNGRITSASARDMDGIRLPRGFVTSLRTNAHPRSVPWAAALAAGLAAGMVLLAVLLLLGATIYDEPPSKLLRMMAATVCGESALQARDTLDTRVALVAMALHFGLSTLYALAFAGLVAEMPRWLLGWLGIAFGVALYFANLHGFTELFPWFAELRTTDTLFAH